jgi:hypothetical protein
MNAGPRPPAGPVFLFFSALSETGFPQKRYRGIKDRAAVGESEESLAPTLSLMRLMS